MFIAISLEGGIPRFDRVICHQLHGFGLRCLELALSIPIRTERVDLVLLDEEGLVEGIVINGVDAAIRETDDSHGVILKVGFCLFCAIFKFAVLLFLCLLIEGSQNRNQVVLQIVGMDVVDNAIIRNNNTNRKVTHNSILLIIR